MDPLEKIDNLLIQHKQKIYNAAHWTEAFSVSYFKILWGMIS